MSVPSQHPLFTEEVRVALALNGGVSLAVWMAGCVVELDAARRGHLGPEQLDAGTQAARRSIYSTMCDAFDRQLVVDLMTSSGRRVARSIASRWSTNGAVRGTFTQRFASYQRVGWAPFSSSGVPVCSSGRTGSAFM